MKPNELRIGNWIKIDDASKEEFQVYSISIIQDDETGEIKRYFVNGAWIHDLLPIPLTEEWLKRFGFEFDIFYQKHTNGKICIYWVNKICMISWCKNHRNGILIDEHPKYVHTLQNLYFALTGEELELRSES